MPTRFCGSIATAAIPSGIAQFDIWRRVPAADGTVGWMSGQHADRPAHRAGHRQGPGADPRKREGGKVVGLADPGAVWRG